ncbi:MAG: ASCH domain-containing protein [Planctomycetota bacterium]
MLLFKRKFLPAILSGEKTQTIRVWRRRLVRAGQRSYTPGVGRIRIDRVEPVDIDQLTDDDAEPDGFPTADALRAELASLYADKMDGGYQAYRVVFHREPDADDA